MKNLFQNKFMVVLIVVSILLVGTTSFISALGYTSYVRNAIGIVFTPIQKGVDSFFDGIESFFASKEDYDEIKKQNESLKLELSKKEEQLAKAELAEKENEELKNYLGIKEEHTDFVFADAKVTGRQANTHTEIYTLDKGSHHGIKPGMPVIDKFGLVGFISEVGLNWSKATSIIEPEAGVGVYVERTGDQGLTSGTFSSAQNGVCKLSYLPDGADVQVGDRIITSGDGSLYPKGLFVGTVESLDKDPISRELIAYVKPAANLTEVDSVMIITEYETVYE